MIDVRIAERPHEKVIGDRVLQRPLPHRQARAVVVAHRERAGVRDLDEAIVASAVDLLLLRVELVDEIARRHVERHVDRRPVDAERPVRQVFRERRIRVLALPHRRQMRKRLAVVVDLRGLRGRRVGDAVGPREQPVQVVEAAVFRIDDDDVLDPVDSRLGRERRHRAARGDQHRERRRQRSPDLPRIQHWNCPPLSVRATRGIGYPSMETPTSVQSRATLARTVPARSCRARTSIRSPRFPRTIHSIFARSSVTL